MTEQLKFYNDRVAEKKEKIKKILKEELTNIESINSKSIFIWNKENLNEFSLEEICEKIAMRILE